MPASDNSTLDLIQQEIMDVMEREKELRRMNELMYNRSQSSEKCNADDDARSDRSRSSSQTSSDDGSLISNNNNGEISQEFEKIETTTHHYTKNTITKQNSSDGSNNYSNMKRASTLNNINRIPLTRAYSASALNQGETKKSIFAGRPRIMETFFKNKGRMPPPASTVTFTYNNNNNNTKEDVYQPPKLPVDGKKHVRNGWVPIEEKLRREIQEAQQRESELKTLRKSQGIINTIQAEDENDGEDSDSDVVYPIRVTKSVTHLYDSCETLDDFPSHTNLKPTLSLAQLCDVDDEYQPTQNIINHFESIIKKNNPHKADLVH